MANKNINNKKFVFLFFKGEFEEWMKALELGQEFFCFSFVIEDGKRVVNISKIYWILSCLRK